jgi:hypothetical protein
MSVASAIFSTVPSQRIQLIVKGRTIDYSGFLTGADDKETFFNAAVVPLGNKERKALPDGSIGIDANNVYCCGEIDIQLDDQLIFCGSQKKAKVLASTYWEQGNFTHIIAQVLTRRQTKYA